MSKAAQAVQRMVDERGIRPHMGRPGRAKMATETAKKARAPRAGKKGLLLITTKDLPRVQKALQHALDAGVFDADRAEVELLQARVEARM